MRLSSFARPVTLVLILSVIFSCKSETEIFNAEQLSQYMPLAIGKYITYRIDSTVFPNFGRSTEIHKYQVKHVIESQITDNLGRPSYRVFRYLRDTAGTQPWTPGGSYFITPQSDQVEIIEDNLRFIKLHAIIREGNNWKGNRFLPPDPYRPLYNFSNDDDIDEWDYNIDNLSSSFLYRGFTYPDVYTIEEADESFNYPNLDPNFYAARTRAVEKYSKNIGLVYREYELWEYQPNTGGSGGPYRT
ncbi:MAG TPA: hypothetical protein VLJ68_10875, partial [Chitinophagaceae bacterium]|nr:hypothetical protein [Chitinophagaceae bacterium]